METRSTDYVLGHTRQEYERLARQGDLMKPMTRRLFEDAGIQPGMHVLDAGAGAGDVSLLLAEMVGHEGHVTGIDSDPGVLEFARQRAAEAGFGNITFVHADLTEYAPEQTPAQTPAQTFDAIVGRLVLLYQPDPAAALSALTRHLRPGGIVAFQEPWFMLVPPADTDNPVMRIGACILHTMQRSGARLDMGARLHRVFEAAGLARPHMRFEAVMDGNDHSPLFQIIADSLASLLPKAVGHGLVQPGEIDVAGIPALLQAAMDASGYAAMILPTVSAWSRKAETQADATVPGLY